MGSQAGKSCHCVEQENAQPTSQQCRRDMDDASIVEIVFTVVADTTYGSRIKVVGSSEELGNWCPATECGVLEHLQYPRWSTTIQFRSQPRTDPVEYTFIIVQPDGHIVWEDGANRRLPFWPSSGSRAELAPARFGQWEATAFSSVCLSKKEPVSASLSAGTTDGEVKAGKSYHCVEQENAQPTSQQDSRDSEIKLCDGEKICKAVKGDLRDGDAAKWWKMAIAIAGVVMICIVFLAQQTESTAMSENVQSNESTYSTTTINAVAPPSPVQPPTPTPPPHEPLTPEPPRRQTCEEQWSHMACVGQFGRWECKTCGQRIEDMKTIKRLPDAIARQRVADAFPRACGACGMQGGDTKFSDEGYSLVFEEDFDGNAVNAQRWNLVHQGGGFGNNEVQFYTNRTKNAFVRDGKLTIRAIKEEFDGPTGRQYFTSAKLESRQSWRYAKVLIRTCLAGALARGTWAANWMMPRHDKYGRWPRSGEIDIMEHVGYDTGRVHGTVHTKAYNHLEGTQIGGIIETDVRQWRTYLVEWRPDIILFGVDNEVYQIFRKESDSDTDVWPFKEDFFLILNLAVGGNWGAQRGIDENAFRGNGQEMQIDSVKVYQKQWSKIVV